MSLLETSLPRLRRVAGEAGSRPPRRSPLPAGASLPGLRRVLLLPAAVALGWLVVDALARGLDVTITRENDARGVLIGAAVAAGALLVPVLLLTRRRPAVAADLVVVATAVGLCGLLTLGLHGTGWGVGGLYGDSSFRTETATRYADGPALVDYGYAGLPAYYPPALGWLQGRTADLFDIVGWQTAKPLQLLLAGLVPLLAYALWQRVLGQLPAALVVAATSLLSADLYKADEWLVLACAVPWWLDAFRGVRAEGVRPWPAWRHGVIAGLLLLVHTYYFLPLAVATLLGGALDLARRRPLPLPPVRALVLVLVGLVVATPYWWGVLLERLAGTPADDLQRRYTYPYAGVPAIPVPISVVGLFGLVGVGWVLVHRRDRFAAALATVLAAAYATVVGGYVLGRLGIPLLTFKTNAMIESLQVSAGVLGLLTLAPWLPGHPWVLRWSLPVRRTAAAFATVLVAVAPAVVAALAWGTGDEVVSAQTTRYPSGQWPAGWDGREPEFPPAWVEVSDPTTDEVLASWHELSGRLDDSATVLVTSRVDLLATTPLHTFVTWKSYYSNPFGQWEDRVALLRAVAACTDSACAAELLRDNTYDAVDGLVLERDGTDLLLQLLVDDDGNRKKHADVRFPVALFDGPEFATRVVGNSGRIVVVDLR